MSVSVVGSETVEQPLSDGEKLATLGLWAIPGIGPQALAQLRQFTDGTFEPLLTMEPRDWAPGLPEHLRDKLPPQSLRSLGEMVLDACVPSKIRIAFPCDQAFPRRLLEIEDAPPVLFYWGEVRQDRKRIAMVGTRSPPHGVNERAFKLARKLALHGVGIVSGAARGVDHACHLGALDAKGETWAFLGSALDDQSLDSYQRRVAEEILEGDGVVFSEFPPGARANTGTFPRRNRLISGASDVVLVVRCRMKSGAMHTAKYATAQGRPLFGLISECDDSTNLGVLSLLATDEATHCEGAGRLLRALEVEERTHLYKERPAVFGKVDDLSPPARTTLELLDGTPRSFEDIFPRAHLDSAALTAALCELELFGFVIQRPGRMYERV